MAGHRCNDALMCLIFLASLGELGLKRFKRLLEGSIKGWQQLAEAFVTRFKTNTRTLKEVNYLLSVKMESGGPLKRINEHIRVEDNAATATEKANPVAADGRVAGKVHSVGQEDNRPNDRARDQHRGSNCNDRNKSRRNDRTNAPRNEEEDAKRKLKARIGIATVFKIPIYRILSEIRGEPYVRWPAKLGDIQRGFNSRYRCTFYEERGHRMKDCVPLKQHLKELVAAGHLD
ncbi:uncharacterized protein LOC114274971 [Camellia sinensis]|uniref:uncharacterized protein LOC114274971 n=1 Tax=Camellia sinensis TaxID=4442 RepID=UPI0010361888|nr:uncharacterized protein LOC114274971 [Camellia sinensis]